MAKVLVFEADSAFASELRTELEGRGCQVTVVDDASVGLQSAASDPPDLIILTIELPRMNGFSVCNKLKRDPSLKAVPLIILSSDSTEETFEQHRRLRTRAEEYVHKPVKFGDLETKIRQYVQLGESSGAPPSSEAEPVPSEDVVIEEAIDFDDAVEVDVPAKEKENVDDEVDQFTEDAFDALLDPNDAAAVAGAPKAPSKPPPPRAKPEADDLDLADAESLPPASLAPDRKPEEESVVRAAPRSTSVRPSTPPSRASSPPGNAVDAARIRQLEREAEDLREKLEDEQSRHARKDVDFQRLQKDADELKAKMASGAKGAPSAREFLDLREALNKKDKEILDLRDSLTHKEKELLGLKDGALVVEREKADLNDKISAQEKELHDIQRALESAKADKDQASKRADDYKKKTEKLSAELEAKAQELAEAREKHEEDLATRDAKEASLRASHQEALEAAEAAKQAAVAEAEAEGARKAEQAVAVAQGKAEEEQARALAEAAEKAEEARRAAVAQREAELKKELDSKLAALHRANEDVIAKLKAEHDVAMTDAASAAAQAFSQKEEELVGLHGEEIEKLMTARDATKADLASTREDFERLKEEKASGDAGRDAKIATLEEDYARTAAELNRASKSLATETRRVESAHAKWGADKTALERAKDALAAALAQIEDAENRPIE